MKDRVHLEFFIKKYRPKMWNCPIMDVDFAPYISDEDFLHIVFLDNLSNYFISKMNYYVSLKELEELYHVSCESLEYEKCINEFQSLVKDLLNIGIIRPSRKTLKGKNTLKLDNLEICNDYFMVISPNQLKAILDTFFENY